MKNKGDFMGKRVAKEVSFGKKGEKENGPCSSIWSWKSAGFQGLWDVNNSADLDRGRRPSKVFKSQQFFIENFSLKAQNRF